MVRWNSDRTSPTEKIGSPRKVDQFFRNFSDCTEAIHSVLDQNFRTFWLNGSRSCFAGCRLQVAGCRLKNRLLSPSESTYCTSVSLLYQLLGCLRLAFTMGFIRLRLRQTSCFNLQPEKYTCRVETAVVLFFLGLSVWTRLLFGLGWTVMLSA